MRKIFEDDCTKMIEQISDVKKDIVGLHKAMNKRDSTLVQDITQSMDDIVHSIFILEH